MSGLTFQMLLYVPLGVVVGSLLQRVPAGIRRRLVVRFVTSPLDAESRPYLAQFVLRALLAGLVVASGSLAILRIGLGDAEIRTQWVLVAGSALVFVLLQLIPSRSVSRALNVVVLVVAAFLSFQLAQVHFRSSVESAVSIAAPFEGEWAFTSAGRSTLINPHYALGSNQKYAADLVVDRGGRTFEGTRELASSYHCWDEPILAPADGVVVAVENDHQDWPVGQRDHANPAGNLVIIDIGDGLYVMMAHLRMGSVTMAEGERVVVGDVVGRCGNSGNTSEPHLHMQVQDSPVFNFEDRIETFPFRFTNTIHIRGGTEYPEQQDQFRRNDLVRTKP
ncbi:MAG: M23 family metallopeptidase [Gemmatimonadota bacterium]|nr:M23 family metallopeptidase [Gemmatimonadota bacterium]